MTEITEIIPDTSRELLLKLLNIDDENEHEYYNTENIRDTDTSLKKTLNLEIKSGLDLEKDYNSEMSCYNNRSDKNWKSWNVETKNPDNYNSNNNIENNSLISVGDYNDLEILKQDNTKNISTIKKKLCKTNNCRELFAATLQLAVTGLGKNKSLFYKYNGEEKSIDNLFKKYNIISDYKLMNKTDISLDDLLMVFSKHIKNYLIFNENIKTYLFDYSNGDLKYRHICFPGAEYIVDKDEGIFLYNTYRRLDSIHKTKLSFKVRRVLFEKNINLNLNFESNYKRNRLVE